MRKKENEKERKLERNEITASCFKSLLNSLCLLKHLQASWYLPNFVDWHSPISVTTTEDWWVECEIQINSYT
jgi:hypothetical protein